MTLREALGGDADRLHELLEELLDREDVVVLLFDGRRAVTYINGFGLSPSQHELMALDIERTARAAGATGASDSGRRRTGRDKRADSTVAGRRTDGGMADGRSANRRSGDATHGDRGLASRPVLRLASAGDARRSR